MDGWQRAFVLHSRPWSETSLMLDVFTEESGRVRLVAKGARRSAEAVSLALPLSGITLYSGLYVNELISRVLEHETRFSELFFDYLHCIQALAGATGTPEPVLRRFELALLGHLGYGVDFLHCAGSGDEVEDTMTYRYREEKGFIASVVVDNSTFTGRQLRALYEREFPDADTLRAAKLGGKPLKSRELFRQLMPKS
ncbi:MAG: DNA repair protein RecO [Enterobacter hormaechei]|nr:DNA repair protein RecO [Enterobacter hormaechei]